MGRCRAPRGIHVRSEVTAVAALMNARQRIAILPTPLHHAPRLSRALGKDVWLKRDDLTGVGLGGNKVRKLELLGADALRHGADTLVSVGAPQSNHARTVAAVARMLGMDCHLVLGGSRPSRPTGNMALAAFTGATLHFADSHESADLDRTGRTVADQLRARGHTPYAVPLGGSTGLGVLAFAAAYCELVEQLEGEQLAATTVLHAPSSGGTQAGLELGRWLLGYGPAVLGVDVAKVTASLADELRRLLDEAAALLGSRVDGIEPRVCHQYLGDGYAIPSKQSTAAMQLLATTEGVLADPVYTAKALHALCDEPINGPVGFWHTGGVPALFSDEVGIHRWPPRRTAPMPGSR